MNDEAIAVQLDENYVDLFHSCACPSIVTFRRDESVAWSVSEFRSEWMHGVFRTAVRGEALRDLVTSVFTSFQSRKRRGWWRIGPTTAHADEVRETLEKRGATVVEDEHVLALDLSLPATPAGDRLVVSRVQSGEQLTEWLSIFSVCFDVSTEDLRLHRLVLEPTIVDSNTAFELFLALDNGSPVAIASLFGSGQVAGLYNIGVSDRVRGRGHARAIIDYCRDYARERGFTTIGGFASGVVSGLYISAGARVIGSRPCCLIS